MKARNVARKVSSFVVAALLLVQVVGCSSTSVGGGSSAEATSAEDCFQGTWMASSGELSGEPLTLEELRNAGLDLGVVFGKDGLAYFTVDGETVADPFVIDGDQATVTDSNTGTKMIFERGDAGLTLDYGKIQWAGEDAAYAPSDSLVLYFERGGSDEGEASSTFSFVGQWDGVECWSQDNIDNPNLLSDLGAAMSLSFDSDRSGTMRVEMNGEAAEEKITLEESDKTSGYLVKYSDGTVFGYLGTATNGSTDWIMITSSDGTTVSYRRV